MDNNKPKDTTLRVYGSNLVSIRFTILALLYSICVYFIFDHHGYNPKLLYTPLLGGLFYYLAFLILCMPLASWMTSKPKFVKNVGYTGLFLIVLVAVLTVTPIPVGFGNLGVIFWGTLLITLSLFTLSVFVEFFTRKFIDQKAYTSTFATILWTLLIAIVLVNLNDLYTVSKLDRYHYGESFSETLERQYTECSNFISNLREDSCKKEFQEKL